jgi:hypothetical protein
MHIAHRAGIPKWLHVARTVGTLRAIRAIWSRWFLLYPRVCTGCVGYIVISLFTVGFGGALWFGASDVHAFTAGLLAVAPIIVAIVGVRVTGIKAFGVEVTLSEIVPPVAGDHASVGGTVSQSLGQGDPTTLAGSGVMASGVGSASNDLIGPFNKRSARSRRSSSLNAMGVLTRLHRRRHARWFRSAANRTATSRN